MRKNLPMAGGISHVAQDANAPASAVQPGEDWIGAKYHIFASGKGSIGPDLHSDTFERLSYCGPLLLGQPPVDAALLTFHERVFDIYYIKPLRGAHKCSARERHFRQLVGSELPGNGRAFDSHDKTSSAFSINPTYAKSSWKIIPSND
jgi:hypothetical protein